MTQAVKTKKIFDGRYEILSIVGRGARSVVYHARHVASPNSEVALKVLLDQKGKSTSGERLRKEALAMVSSRHKYVVRLDDFHSVGSLCYLSMEYAPESDLRRFIQKTGGRISPELAERFMLQVAEALSFVHRAGIIHRDVKPDNILVMNEKEVRIADFGVAVLPGEEATLEDLQSGVGTMNYMAPEVLEGKGFDARSDIYSLGVTFYELLSGKNPFEKAPLAQQIDARKDEKVPPLSQFGVSVPEYLESVIRQAMSFQREARFPSAKDLVQTLLVNKSTVSAKPVVAPTPPAPAPAPQSQTAPVSAPMPAPEAPAPAPTPVVDTKKEDSIFEIPENEESIFGNSEIETADASEPSVTDTTEQFGTPAEVEPNSFWEKMKQSTRKKTVFIDRGTVEEIRSTSMVGRSMGKPTHDFQRSILLAVSILFFLGLFLPGLRHEINALSIKYLKLDMSRPFSHSEPAIEMVKLPAVQTTDISFPNLPSGMYSGTISALLPDKTLPFTIISFEERNELAFLVGMEGWKTAVVKPPAHEEAQDIKPLRVASNGFIMEFTGQNVDGQLFGFFKNLFTGEQGEWSAQPVKPAES